MKLLNTNLKVRGQADTQDTKDRVQNLQAFFGGWFFSKLV